MRIYLSGTRDVSPLLEQAYAVCSRLAEDAKRRNQQLEPWYWKGTQFTHEHGTGYQEAFPRPSAGDVAASVFILGERVGTTLPHTNQLPADFVLPEDFRWRNQNPSAPIPLTGTLFEYLDWLQAATRARSDGRASTPALVYFVGEAKTITDQTLAPLRRGWGMSRLYQSIHQQPEEAERLRPEYLQQVSDLTAFFDRYMVSAARGHEQSRPISFIEKPDDFATILNRDLRNILNLRQVYSVRDALRGMESYRPTDHYVFFGRSEDARACMRQLARRDEAKLPTLALVQAPSGAGKSSFVGAGLIGGVQQRKFADYGALHGQVFRARDLVEGAAQSCAGSVRADHVLAELMVRLCEPAVGLNLGQPSDVRSMFTGLDSHDGQSLALEKIRTALAAATAARGRTFEALSRLVIAIDQAELMIDELRGADGSNSLWSGVVSLLTALADQRSAWVIFVLPDSRLPRWNEIPELRNRAMTFPLGNPGHLEREQIIEGITECLGASLHPDLMNELSKSLDAYDTGERGAAVLPILSLGLRRLFGAWSEQSTSTENPIGTATSTLLLLEKYAAFADLRDVIQHLGDEAWLAAMQGRPVFDEEEIVDAIFRQLVSMEGSNLRRLRPSAIEKIVEGKPPQTARLVDALIDCRILVREPDGGISLAHEVILDRWDRANQWYVKARTDLVQLSKLEDSARTWSDKPEGARRRHLERNPSALRFAGRALAHWSDRLSSEASVFARGSLLTFYNAEEDEPSEETGSTLVTFAAYADDRELLDHYVRTAGSPAILNRSPWSALDAAISGDHYELARWCVEQGVDVAAIATKDGWSKLHLVASRGGTAIAKLLLDAGVDCRQAGPNGTSALMLACLRGNADMVEVLLPRSDFDGPWNGTTPLHEAAQMGHAAVIRRLAQLEPARVKAQTSIVNGDGLTPLQLAITRRSFDAAEALIEAGSPVQFPDTSEPTPISVALQLGAWRAATLLVQRGAPLPLSVMGDRIERLASTQPARVTRDDFLADLSTTAEPWHRPLFAAEWTTLSPDEAANLLVRFVTEQLARDAPNQAVLFRHRRLRSTPLDFYPGHRLVEGEVVRRDGGTASYHFLEGPRGCVGLDGTNGPIYALNEAGRLDISSPEHARHYALFFFGVVRGRHGRFLIVETPSEVPWRDGVSVAAANAIAAKLEPLLFVESTDTEHRFHARTTMVFKDSLFGADVLINPGGKISMANETLILDDLPLKTQVISEQAHYAIEPEAVIPPATAPQLSQAAANGLVDTVRQLLDEGAEPGSRDEKGLSAMEWAFIGGNGAVVDLLLSRAPDLLTVAQDGTTALLRLRWAFGREALRAAITLLGSVRNLAPLAVLSPPLPSAKHRTFSLEDWIGFGGLAGAWRVPTVIEAERSLLQLEAFERAHLLPTAGSEYVASMRCTALACYPSLTLFEALIEREGARYIRAWLADAESLTCLEVLQGSSGPVHALNQHRLAIDSTLARRDYLALFCEYVCGDAGPFHIVRAASELPVGLQGNQALQGAIAGDIEESESNGKTLLLTYCRYGRALFKATFLLAPNGELEMTDDLQVARDLSGPHRVSQSSYFGMVE